LDENGMLIVDPKYIVSEDVSQGTSHYPLRCINEVDDEKFPSTIQFISICKNDDEEAIDFLLGCTCGEKCGKDTNCICAGEMNGVFPYSEDGRLDLEVGYPIYECNAKCSCSSSCRNRLVQKGPQFKVELYKTLKKGWGVRAVKNIPKGTFICEYIGEIITTEEAEKRGRYYDSIQCSYLYDLDMDGSNRYTIDATNCGNVSRFINHSCDPNLQNYQVWIDSLDTSRPRIALFAKRKIYAGEELNYDYKYDLKTKGKRKSITCHCGSKKCKGILV